MIKDITKENGKVEYYEHSKAVESIFAAMQRCEDVRANRGTATKLVHKIEKELSEKFKDSEDPITTNDWAEVAFKVLKKYNRSLCDSYKERRMEKQLNRLQHSGLMRGFKDVLESAGDDPNSINTENANIDGFNPAAQLHRIGSEANKAYVLDYLLPKDIAKAHREKWMHIHDMDYLELNPNCLQVDLKAALKDGFNTGSSQNTEPQSIITAAMLSSIVLQSSTNGMHGGQSIANLDYALAKYVNISYRKAFLKSIDNYFALNEKDIPFYFKRSIVNKFYYGITVDGVNELLARPLTKSQEKLYSQFIKIAEKDTEKETGQAMQALCHNLCTLHSRAADQVPFSSVNVGLDMSASGRLVTTKLFETIIKGAGNNETFIYPIVIFHVLEGVNYFPGDPNYDLYRLAIRSSAKRLYPNYNFIDSPFQFQFIRNKKGQLLWLAKER